MRGTIARSRSGASAAVTIRIASAAGASGSSCGCAAHRSSAAVCGGATAELGALLVGGYFGSWVAVSDALAAPLSASGFAPLGAGPGARAIVAFPSSSCGVRETARVARWLAAESAAQCGPCVHGLDAVASDLEELARGRSGTAVKRSLERRLGLVEGRGACRHPDGAARFVASALEVFGAEAELHAHGRCSGRAAQAVLPLPRRTLRAEP